MLAQSVVQEFGGKAKFVVENYGDSALAKRFGVTRYPALFVDDVLVATPNDFGFYGRGEKEGGGRYAPLKSAEAHERLRADLTRMIDLILAGKKDAARAQAAPAAAAEIATLPDIPLEDLDGAPVSREALAGRVVLVEFWATWCPPCLSTMGWLKHLDPDSVNVVAVAVDSQPKDIDAVVAKLQPAARIVIGSPELRAAFDGPPAVPTMVLADSKGKIVRIFYGAPANLHDEIEKELAKL